MYRHEGSTLQCTHILTAKLRVGHTILVRVALVDAFRGPLARVRVFFVRSLIWNIPNNMKIKRKNRFSMLKSFLENTELSEMSAILPYTGPQRNSISGW